MYFCNLKFDAEIWTAEYTVYVFPPKVDEAYKKFGIFVRSSQEKLPTEYKEHISLVFPLNK